MGFLSLSLFSSSIVNLSIRFSQVPRSVYTRDQKLKEGYQQISKSSIDYYFSLSASRLQSLFRCKTTSRFDRGDPPFSERVSANNWPNLPYQVWLDNPHKRGILEVQNTCMLCDCPWRGEWGTIDITAFRRKRSCNSYCTL